MNCPHCGSENDDHALFCKTCGAKLTNLPEDTPSQQTPILPARVDYAGFWRRFVAFIIDAIILGIIAGALNLISGGMGSFHDYSDFGPRHFGSLMFSNFFSGLIAWLYYALLESSSKQATVGKMALGLLVTDMNGNRISFLRATGRHFSKIISSLILMIGYIMAGITARKQALHDMIAGTLVLVSR